MQPPCQQRTQPFMVSCISDLCIVGQLERILRKSASGIAVSQVWENCGHTTLALFDCAEPQLSAG